MRADLGHIPRQIPQSCVGILCGGLQRRISHAYRIRASSSGGEICNRGGSTRFAGFDRAMVRFEPAVEEAW